MTGRNVYITNTASFLPNDPVTNEEIEQVLGMVGGKPSRARRIVLKNNGITSRFYVIDKHTGQVTYSNAQLTAQAVRRLETCEFTVNDLDCLATGTTLPDQLMPNHGVMVHGELGNPACEVIATAGICLAGITALKYAYLGVLAGEHDYAVATGSETSSTMMHARRFQAEAEHLVEELHQQPILAFEKDFLRWMLSDGAGAVLLRPSPRANGLSLRIDWLKIFSYANEMDTCMYAGAEKQADGSLRSWLLYDGKALEEHSVMSVKQDVKLLNENIIRYTVEKPLERLVAQLKLRADDYDFFLPHMSSCYFAKSLKEGMTKAGLPIPEQRWFTNLTSKGNTGSASFYIMLDELFNSGRLAPGQKLLCFIPESGRFSSAYIQLTVV